MIGVLASLKVPALFESLAMSHQPRAGISLGVSASRPWATSSDTGARGRGTTPFSSSCSAARLPLSMGGCRRCGSDGRREGWRVATLSSPSQVSTAATERFVLTEWERCIGKLAFEFSRAEPAAKNAAMSSPKSAISVTAGKRGLAPRLGTRPKEANFEVDSLAGILIPITTTWMRS